MIKLVLIILFIVMEVLHGQAQKDVPRQEPQTVQPDSEQEPPEELHR